MSDNVTKPLFHPRPAQREVLAYTGGKMGVSAVPGAGKTYVLSVLAAQLVASSLDEDQEVLVVTLVNSAVENIKTRIAQFVGDRGLLANVGYRVRTLHGLAHDIVRQRPGLVGLAEDFAIVDERTADQIREDVVEVWLRSHPHVPDTFLSLDLADNQRAWAASTQWPDAVRDLTTVFIKRAKDRNLSPEDLFDLIEARDDDQTFALARMGAEIYADYQKSLYYRGGVDFDDLIRLAQVALQSDRELLDRLHHTWPYILEDEAQDSSLSQETILRLIAGPNGNWVRVGDPNQAINTTFTTADPRFLREFLREADVSRRSLHNSGRSQQCIIDLANYLVHWTIADHPEQQVRDALGGPPFIKAVPPGDPQPNPEANRAAVHLVDHRYSPEREIQVIVTSVSRWLSEHPEEAAAILVPRNHRGFEVTDALKRANIPYVELLRSTTSTRQTAGALGNVLKYLANPSSAPLLSRVFEVWRREDREDKTRARHMRYFSSLIRTCRHVETYLWPRPGRDWLDSINWVEDGVESQETEVDGALSEADSPKTSDRAMLEAFRELVRRWQEATILPIDQLILTIAQDLFIEPGELALSHKLAVMLRAVSESNPDWRLSELTTELAVIARNQRRFLGFTDEDSGLTAERGKVTVSTLHKAKGLEWDRVYLMSVNNYNFPSAQSYDEYISEKWFIRNQLNLEAEALEQVQAWATNAPYVEGSATYQARLDYVAERLRLLYVGITRAKKELVVTWNTGRSRQAKQMAVPFIALHTWWEQEYPQDAV
jgi:DNA helicase-2/ATP-dependent DNA helicase PcrA